MRARSRWGSLEHEFWKHKIAEHMQTLGYTAALEEPVNGYTDIILQYEKGAKVAIEIETGKSDWRANIIKNLKKGIGHIILAVTNDEALTAVLAATNTEYAERGKITVVPAWEVIDRSIERLLDR